MPTQSILSKESIISPDSSLLTLDDPEDYDPHKPECSLALNTADENHLFPFHYMNLDNSSLFGELSEIPYVLIMDGRNIPQIPDLDDNMLTVPAFPLVVDVIDEARPNNDQIGIVFATPNPNDTHRGTDIYKKTAHPRSLLTLVTIDREIIKSTDIEFRQIDQCPIRDVSVGSEEPFDLRVDSDCIAEDAIFSDLYSTRPPETLLRVNPTLIRHEDSNTSSEPAIIIYYDRGNDNIIMSFINDSEGATQRFLLKCSIRQCRDILKQLNSKGLNLGEWEVLSGLQRSADTIEVARDQKAARAIEGIEEIARIKGEKGNAAVNGLTDLFFESDDTSALSGLFGIVRRRTYRTLLYNNISMVLYEIGSSSRVMEDAFIGMMDKLIRDVGKDHLSAVANRFDLGNLTREQRGELKKNFTARLRHHLTTSRNDDYPKEYLVSDI
jgi:hypothetical protein